MVGGHLQNVTAGMNLTPAAALAVSQVLASGRQNLGLNALSAATNGSLLLNQSSASVSSMVIPSGVRVVQGLDSNALNIAGTLSNAGTLYFTGHSSATNSLAVNAANIINTGLLGTAPGTAWSLSLNSLGDVVNSGRIVSGGALSVTSANGSVTNNGSMQASGNLNVTAGSVTNTGSIASDNGSITVASLGGPLAFNGTGGTLSALNGNINLNGNGINVSGGDYLSRNMNINAGCGLSEVDISNVTGVVNIAAADSHFAAQTSTLHMGEMTVTDDPSLTNTGNIDIKSLKPVTGGDYLILAGGSITASAGSLAINTSSATANGGNVVLAAGVLFKGSQITGTSLSGGDINLTGQTLSSGLSIDTHSSKLNGNGGNVTVAAYSNPSNTFGGHVTLPGGINTSAANGTTGGGGSVTIVGNASSATSGFPGFAPVTITVAGDITTAGVSQKPGTGAVTISTSGLSGPVTLNAGTAAVTSGVFTGGPVKSGAVSLGNITTSGGPVTINAGLNAAGGASMAISTGLISTGATATGSGGAVSVQSGLAPGGSGSGNIVTGSISTNGSGTGNAGSVLVSGPGTLTVGTVSSNATGTGNGGSVILNGTGNWTYPNISTTGTNGGSVQITSAGDLSASGTSTINTSASAAGGTGGNILMAAGANTNITPGVFSLISAGTGGSLNLGSVAGGNLFSTGGASANSSGGDVTLLAYGGGGATGTITTANGSTIQTSGNASGTSGNINIVAGGGLTGGNTISIGSLITSGGASNSGAVGLYTYQPGAINVSSKGAVSGALLQTATSGVINYQSVSTTGGAVTMQAGLNSVAAPAIAGGPITTTSGNNNGGKVFLQSGSAGAGANGDINVGAITTRGQASGITNVRDNHSGDVVIDAATNITVGAIDTTDAGLATAIPSANGGNVTLHAGSASTTGNINFSTIRTSGVSGGNINVVAGGNITSGSPSPLNASSRKALPSNAQVNFGDGGSVSLIAGVLSSLAGDSITLFGKSGVGGNISLTSTAGTAVDTSSNAFHGSGGSVRLIAYGGANTGYINVQAPIVTKGAQRMVDVDAGGSVVNFWSGASGDVLAMAGGTSTAGTPSTIVVKDITTTALPAVSNLTANSQTLGGATGTGFVELLTTAPNTSVANQLVLQTNTGTIDAGDFGGGVTVEGAVSAGNINTTGGNIRIVGGGSASGANSITTGNLITSVPAANVAGTFDVFGNGGYVTLVAGGAGLGSAGVAVGTIATQGYTGSSFNTGSAIVAPPVFAATGGAVTVLTTGSVTTGSITTGDLNSANSGGLVNGAVGGNVLMLAGTPGVAGGNVNVGAISTVGFGGGDVELYTISSNGAITASSVSTQMYEVSLSAGRSAGSIAMSSPGNISTGNLNASILGAVGSAGNAFLSSAGNINVTASQFIGQSVNGNGYGQTNGSVSGGLIAVPWATFTPNAAPTGATVALPDTVNIFAPPTAPIIQTLHNGASSSFSPFQGGGFNTFSSINENISIGSSSPGRLIIPLASLSSAGVNVTGGNWNTGGVVLRFIGNDVNLNTNFNQSVTGISAVANGATSSGVVTFNNTVDANNYVQSLVSSNRVNITGSGSLTIQGDINSPGVNISMSQGNAVALAFAGNVQGFGRILTQNLGLNISLASPSSAFGTVLGSRLTTAGAASNTALNTVSGINALQLGNNTLVGSLDLANAGNVSMNGASAYSQTGFDSYSFLQVFATSTSKQTGSIRLQGDIGADFGYISLTANGGIFTEGTNRLTSIHAIGRTGVAPTPAGGNNIFLFAGTNFLDGYNVANGLSGITAGTTTIPGRSGYGGDISLPGLNPTNPTSAFQVSTDRNGLQGNIDLIAYSNVSPNFPSTKPARVDGGRILLPQDINVNVISPNGTGPSTQVGQGITLVGEAEGGDQPTNTIVVGNVSAGIVGLKIGAFTPNINSSTNPSSTFIAVGNTITSGTGGIFQGLASPNANVVAGDVAILGTGGVANQQLKIIANDISVGSIRTVGLVGFTPIPGTLAAYPGGSGGDVILQALGNILVNGPIYTFGGGGGGGMGDPGTAGGGGLLGGGIGGNAGNGGNVTLSSASKGTITVNGDINTSGGGGGGGGGGYASASASLGGAGGQGGGAGTISIATSGGIVNLLGSVIAAGGGHGGKGGDGPVSGAALSNGYAGSGGGGGGSFGSGGGGGGGGGSAGAGKDGFGGGGGGGLQAAEDVNFYSGGGAGGGDVQNAGTQRALGGYGGGGYTSLSVPAEGINASPAYGIGVRGGFGEAQSAGITISGDGLGATGGSGAFYAPSPAILLPTGGNLVPGAALGGNFGQGGQGGQKLNVLIPASAGVGGGSVGSAGAGGDGKLTVTAGSFISPSKVYVGTLLYGSILGATGNIVVRGTQIVTGYLNGVTANPLATAVVQTQISGNGGGNITFLPNTVMQVYNGTLIINTLDPVAAIEVGANSQLSAGSASGLGVVGLINGPVQTTGAGTPDFISAPNPIAPGAAPGNVSSIVPVKFPSTLVKNILYGAKGFTAGGPVNTVYALGSNSFVGFNAANKSLIKLDGGVQIAASSMAALSSLDLTTNANSIQLITAQNSGIIGGKLTFTGSGSAPSSIFINGGNVVLYPSQIRQTIDSLSIPSKTTVQLVNFASINPINLNSTANSSTENTLINGALNFTALNGVAVAPSINVTSVDRPLFSVGTTGSITSVVSLNLNAAGDVALSGPVKSTGNLSIGSQTGTAGDITVASTVSGKNVSLTTSQTGGVLANVGVFNGNSGSVTASGDLSISTSQFNVTGTKLSAAAGTLTIDNNNDFSIATNQISIGGAAAFNLTPTLLAALTAKTLQIGSSNNFGGITVGVPLNTVSKATLGSNFVGSRNFSLVSSGAINADQNFLLGSNVLAIKAGTSSTLGAVTNGTVNANSDFNLTVNGDITTKTGSTVLGAGLGTLNLNNHITGGGTATTLSGATITNAGPVNGKSVTINTFAPGGLGSVTTTASTLSVSAPGSSPIISDNQIAIALNASNGLNFTLNMTAPAKTTLTVAGVQNFGGSLNYNFAGTDGALVIKNNITAGGAATIHMPANSAGGITQSATNWLLTANTVDVSTAKGSIGTAAIPLNVSAANVSVNAGVTTAKSVASSYIVDNANATLSGANLGAGGTFSFTDTAIQLPGSPVASLNVASNVVGSTVILAANNPTSGTLTDANPISGPAGTAAKAVTLQSSGFGSMSVLGTINAPTLTVLGGGDITALTTIVNTNASAINLNSGGTATITDTFSAAGKTLTFANAKAGLLNLTASANTSVTAATNASIGGLGGSVAGTYTVKSNGLAPVALNALTTTGTFTASNPGGFSAGGTVTAPKVILSSTLASGSIAANTATSDLTVNATAASTASVTGPSVALNNNSANLILEKSGSGSTFNVTTTGNLTVLGVVNKGVTSQKTNNVTITGNGSTLINGAVTVNGGGLTVRNTSASGTITLSPLARLTTLIVGKSAATDGQIQIFNGATAGASTGAGSVPGVVVTNTAPGMVTFNTSGGTYTGPVGGTAQVQASKANVTFNNGSGSIVINKGAFVKADPISLLAPAAGVLTQVPMQLVVVNNAGGMPQASVQGASANIVPASTTSSLAPQVVPANSTNVVLPTVMNSVPTVIAPAKADDAVAVPMTLVQNGEFVIDTDEELQPSGVVMNGTDEAASL